MNFKEYLKFRKLFKYFTKTGNLTVSSYSVNLKTKDLYYLNAKGVIEISPLTNNEEYCKITLSNKGILHRDNLILWLFQTFLPIALSVAALIVSIIKD